MILLDAHAVIALLRGGPVGREVRLLGESGPTAVSWLNLAETVDQLVRVFARPVNDVLADLAISERGGLDVIPVDGVIATRAGRIRAQHYGSKSCPVSMADCVAAATALALGADLATADPDLASVARAHGIPVIALADSSGERP